ncbi:MAG TPA: tetratricopeptide repeat protein [Candidatus Hydrogenedentes bacterium]|nr:tetratricopeptide repeat protein [Candidatus Hydrogenedentota bacterium]HQE82849.1 tetratricopeptide repeat protein [Candidatus Hydrogenedentota bacterium]HQM49293.1 tetratricopeptide repeat protein [Candidatus Hydrogenedentota bacterium]
MRVPIARVAMAGIALIAAGCATTGRPPELTLRDAVSPVWSLQQTNDELVVALSPAGKSLRLAGSAGIVIGTGVDAVVNAQYRDQIREILGEDDTASILAKGLERRLQDDVGDKLAQVPPISTTAGYSSRREAMAAQYEGLARQNHDTLLLLRTTHGVFGHDGTLAVKIDARQVALPSGSTLWSDDIVVTPAPVLACDRLGDPTDRVSPQVKGARLTVERGVLDQWRGGARSLRDDFAQTVEAAGAALAVSLGLEDDTVGEYHLAKVAMNEKRFDEAIARLNNAIQRQPGFVDAHNALSVTYAHQGKIDEAIAKAKAITEQWPEYGPACMNLAWWYVVEKDDANAAQPFYKRALDLGMEPVEEIAEELP